MAAAGLADEGRANDAGRIVAIREASKNLVFLDVQSDGATVQVLSEVKHFHGSVGDEGDKDAIKQEFRKVHESLRRGDIIGRCSLSGGMHYGGLHALTFCSWQCVVRQASRASRASRVRAS